MAEKSLTGGVIASVVIPFASSGEVDEDLLRAEVKLLDNSPVDGICIGGVFGGTLGSLPEELLALSACARRASHKQLFAMVYPDVTMEAREMIRAVAEGGADVILVAQPHYLSQPDEAGLSEMFVELRSAVPSPLLLADCFPEARVETKTIEGLIKKRLVDGVLQAVDSHSLIDLLCLHADVPIYSGIEDLHYIAFMLGARGVISDFGAIFPENVSDIYRSVRNHEYETAKLQHERLARVWRLMSPPAEREARLRAALAAQGRKVGAARSPYDEMQAGAGQKIAAAMRQDGLERSASPKAL